MTDEKQSQNINTNTQKTSQNTASNSGTSGTQKGKEKEQEITKMDMVRRAEKFLFLGRLFGWESFHRFPELCESEEWKKVEEEFGEFSLEKWTDKADQLIVKLKERARLVKEHNSWLEKQKKGAASTSEGKEIIKADISQELSKAKELFSNFQISPVKYETAKNEIKEKLLELHERSGSEAEINLMINNGVFDSRVEIQRKKKVKAETVAEAMGKTVMKIVSDTITDLEAQKNKISKKIGKLIEARNQEVAEAREIIRTLETINQEARNKNADLQAKIKELLKQLADYQARKEEIEKSFRNKIKTQKTEVKAVMKNDDDRITELERELEETKQAAKIFDESLQNERLQLQHAKEEITRKENELERERKIFLDRQTELNAKIKKLEQKKADLEKDLDDKDEELAQQQPTINQLRTEKEILQTELGQTKREKQELETKYEALTKKSWFFQICDKVGLVSLKNGIANASAVVGFVFVLYAISWMWKNVIKETYRNFKSEPENNQNQPPIITIPPQQQSPLKNHYQPSPPQLPEVKVIEPKNENSPISKEFLAVHPDEKAPVGDNLPKNGKRARKKTKK